MKPNKIKTHFSEDMNWITESAHENFKDEVHINTSGMPDFYPPLERIERKLNAIIAWINWFAKENAFKGGYGGLGGIDGRFETLPTIDIEDCERRDKDEHDNAGIC